MQYGTYTGFCTSLEHTLPKVVNMVGKVMPVAFRMTLIRMQSVLLYYNDCGVTIKYYSINVIWEEFFNEKRKKQKNKITNIKWAYSAMYVLLLVEFCLCIYYTAVNRTHIYVHFCLQIWTCNAPYRSISIYIWRIMHNTKRKLVLSVGTNLASSGRFY